MRAPAPGVHHVFGMGTNRHRLPDVRSASARVRESFSRQELPLALPEAVWLDAGGGFGRCQGCGDDIRREQPQYELQMSDKRLYSLHPGCYGLWLAELIRRRIWRPAPPERPGARPIPSLSDGGRLHTMPRVK